MKKIYILSLFLFITPLFTKAASLSLRLDETTLKEQNKAMVSLWLLPTSENVNAIGGEIEVISNNAKISLIREGSSIISAWVERPRLENNRIIFSGIIPGGFSGAYSPFAKGPQPGLVFSFSVTSEKTEPIILQIVKPQIFAGSGESVSIKLEPEKLIIDAARPIGDVVAINDSTKPVFTSAQIIKLPDSKDLNYVMFIADDKESGIDHYEVQESLSSEPDDHLWTISESPYLLKDQSRKSNIFIRAFNRSGESSITMIGPELSKNIYTKYILIVVGILLITFVFVVFYHRKKRRGL